MSAAPRPYADDVAWRRLIAEARAVAERGGADVGGATLAALADIAWSAAAPATAPFRDLLALTRGFGALGKIARLQEVRRLWDLARDCEALLGAPVPEPPSPAPYDRPAPQPRKDVFG